MCTCPGRRGWRHWAPPPSLGGAGWGAAGWGGEAPRFPCLPQSHTPSDPWSALWLDADWPPGSAVHPAGSGVLDSAHSPETSRYRRKGRWCKQTPAYFHIQYPSDDISLIVFPFSSGVVSTNIFHFLHQLVSNFICLSCGAGQVVCNGFYQSLFAVNSCCW